MSNQLEDMSLLLESGQTDAVFGKLMLITTVVNDVDGRSELDGMLIVYKTVFIYQSR